MFLIGIVSYGNSFFSTRTYGPGLAWSSNAVSKRHLIFVNFIQSRQLIILKRAHLCQKLKNSRSWKDQSVVKFSTEYAWLLVVLCADNFWVNVTQLPVFSVSVMGSEQVFIIRKVDAGAKEPKDLFGAKLLLVFKFQSRWYCPAKVKVCAYLRCQVSVSSLKNVSNRQQDWKLCDTERELNNKG